MQNTPKKGGEVKGRGAGSQKWRVVILHHEMKKTLADWSIAYRLLKKVGTRNVHEHDARSGTMRWNRAC